MTVRGTRPPKALANLVESPGGLLLLPTFLTSTAILVVNDRVLKSRYPGPVTGKLSDFAGLLMFPLLVVSLVEIGRALVGVSWRTGDMRIWSSAVLTALGFTLVKVNPIAARWFEQASDLVTTKSVVVRDLSDLIALPMVVVAALIARRWRSGVCSE